MDIFIGGVKRGEEKINPNNFRKRLCKLKNPAEAVKEMER